MLRATLPAGFDTCLSLAPPTRYGRQVTMNMRLSSETAEIRADGTLICVAYLFPVGGDEHEFCIALAPAARAHIKSLIRFGHLTFPLITKTNRIVSARIREWNTSGERLARLAGFQPDPDTPGKWLWRGRDHHGKPVRRRKETDQHGDRGRPQEPGGQPDLPGTAAATGKRGGQGGQRIDPTAATEGPPAL